MWESVVSEVVMSVSITGAVEDGLQRTVQQNALIVMGMIFTLTVINSLVSFSMGPGTPPLLVSLVSLVGYLLSSIVVIGTIRMFMSDDPTRFAREHFTRRMGWTLLNYIVGTIVYAIIVGIGLVLLVIPGLFLLVALFFWPVYVVAEDESFLTGFGNSWKLTSGHRLHLFALGVVVVILSILIAVILGGVAGFIGGLIASPLGRTATLLGAALGTSIAGAVLAVFNLATMVAAYTQLYGGVTQRPPSADRDDLASAERA